MNHEVQEYIDAVSDDRKQLLLRLQALIVSLYPDAIVRISYKIIKYECKPGWIFLGYWKQGVSIYTGYIKGLPEFYKQHPNIKIGKGSISFKLTDDIPEEDIVQIIRESMQRNKLTIKK